MAKQDFFTNLPPKDKDELQKTVDELVQNQYQEKFQFTAGEFDAAIAFFVKRGFSRTSAETTAYVILSQAKIDSVSPQFILDKITYATPAQLSELITIV